MNREDVLGEASRVAALFEAIGERDSATLVRAAARLAEPPRDPQAPPVPRVEYARQGAGDDAVYAFVAVRSSRVGTTLAEAAAAVDRRGDSAWGGYDLFCPDGEDRLIVSVRGLRSFDMLTRELSVLGVFVREEAAYHRALPTSEAILASYWNEPK